jgi:hypothetical protein
VAGQCLGRLNGADGAERLARAVAVSARTSGAQS